MRRQRLLALMLCGAMALGMAGCGKEDAGPEGGTGQEPTSGTEAGTDGTEAPEKPEGFVDNAEGLGEIPDEQKYDIDENAGLVLGVRDNRVFLDGNGFATRFATNLLSGDPESDGSKGLPLAWVWDRVDYVQFGEKQYELADLVKPRDQGFQVLEMLSKDFGVVVYTSDPETGALVSAEYKGSLSGDELREAYSEREDQEGCTVCVYYLDARMGGMEKAEYDKAREALEAAHGIESDQVLDGTLAVMLYYDTDGYDLYYNIAAIAPGHFQDAADFQANMDASVGHDITNCHMMVDGSTAIGFVNQVFIRCDSDTVPDHTIEHVQDNGNPGYLEEGSPEGADVSPTGSVGADKPGRVDPVPQDGTGSEEAPGTDASDADAEGSTDEAGESGDENGGSKRNTAGAQSGN